MEHEGSGDMPLLVYLMRQNVGWLVEKFWKKLNTDLSVCMHACLNVLLCTCQPYQALYTCKIYKEQHELKAKGHTDREKERERNYFVADG